ncbi:MAG: hypothetical protein NUV58_05115 [Candidatus Roizmanbacteria bacterium]|nr:hypothetical protein [Candidatus Roizmanbacteria bacterium]
MKNKRLMILITTILVIFSLVVRSVKAESNEMHYVISGTRPGNEENNVPPNLETGATGSTCSSSGYGNICSIMIGLGIASDNSLKAIGYPKITNDLFTSDKVTISSSNDPNISTRWSGEQEWSGGGNFYHNFQFTVVNSYYPGGIVLMPNTTYTVTIKGGTNGLKAKYESNYQEYIATLIEDYSFSFTTGNGSTPARIPTSTVVPTIIQPTNTSVPPTNTLIPQNNSQSSNTNSVQNNTPDNQVSPTSMPTTPVGSKKILKEPTPTLIITPTSKQVKKSEIQNKKKTNILEKIRSFFSDFFKKWFKKKT